MDKLITEAFGGADPLLFAFWMLIALASQYLTMYYIAMPKYKEAEGTPSKFSFSFLTRDNLQKMVISFLIAYFGLRMSSVFFENVASFAVAVAIGPASERIANIFRKEENKARE